MDHAVQPAPAPSQRKARKINRQKVMQLSAQGLSAVDIAKHQEVSPSTITRFLQAYQVDKDALRQYKEGRADILAWLQGRNLKIQTELLSRLDGLPEALTPQQICGLLFALNTQHGTLFDKERLERGQSTQNISTISKMLDNQVSTLFKRQVIPHIDPAPAIIPVNSQVVEKQQEDESQK